MARYPTPAPETQNDIQRTIEPTVDKLVDAERNQLVAKDFDGNLLGPYAMIYYTPELANVWFALAGSVVTQPRFSFKEREISILAVLAAYDAPYVVYAHSKIALKCGLCEEQVQQAVDGKIPGGLSQEEAMVYELSLKMANLRGPLDDGSFERAEKILGKVKIAGLAHLVTAYIHVALLTNISNGFVPEEEPGVFRAKKGANVV